MKKVFEPGEIGDKLPELEACLAERSALYDSIDEIINSNPNDPEEFDKLTYFYTCSINLHKALLDHVKYEYFVKLEGYNLEETARKMEEINNISSQLHYKYNINIQRQMLNRAEIDSRLQIQMLNNSEIDSLLAESITYLTFTLLVLTLVLIGLDVSERSEVNLIIAKLNSATFFVVVLVISVFLSAPLIKIAYIIYNQKKIKTKPS